jgi:hypothetical protein
MKHITSLLAIIIGLCVATVAFAQSTGRIPIRDPLTANRTYYVRTDGNDNNLGLVNDAGGAFLTIQHAVDVVAQDLDLSGYSVTIQVATGAYNAPVVLTRCVGTKTVTLQGDTSVPSNVTITLSNGTPISLDDEAVWSVRGFKLSTTAGSYTCLEAKSNAVLFFDSMDFGACTGYHVWARKNSTIVVTGGYAISGGAQIHLLSQNGSYIEVASGEMSSRTISITNTPSFSYFIEAFRGGTILADHNYLTFSGSASGSRYWAALSGVLDTGGGGSSFIPGSSAGTTSPGGQYN